MPANSLLVEEHEVLVETRDANLEGRLARPHGASGIVVFAHGSGSSRFSSRNAHVAHILNEAGLATLLFDLLTPDEERVDVITRQHRFDIPLLARRMVGAVDWVSSHADLAPQRIGAFGASTGAAAALIAAAARPDAVRAVVSRGGRPDLAGNTLGQVRAPTLLIVGGRDDVVIGMNESALARMSCPKRLEIVSGATHLFEEPGTLDEVARLATAWFSSHLQPRASEQPTWGVP